MRHQDFTKIIAKGVYFYDDYGNNCAFCNGGEDYQYSSDKDKFIHEDDCITLKAKALLHEDDCITLKAKALLKENRNLKGESAP